MRYFRLTDEGFHARGERWGGDPTYWLEVNDSGDAERELQVYPNGTVLCYDRAHAKDEFGALSTMVVDGDEGWWARHKIPRESFEDEWRARSPFITGAGQTAGPAVLSTQPPASEAFES